MEKCPRCGSEEQEIVYYEAWDQYRVECLDCGIYVVGESAIGVTVKWNNPATWTRDELDRIEKNAERMCEFFNKEEKKEGQK